MHLSEDQGIDFYPRDPQAPLYLNLAQGLFRNPEIHCIWWRRPNGFAANRGQRDDAVSRFNRNEYSALLYGTLSAVNVPVLNDPYAEARANRKPLQLSAAQKLGLFIPETIISNDPRSILAFWDRCGRNCIYKTLTPMEGNLLEPRRLSPSDFVDIDKVWRAPIIVQEVVFGLDVRINVIGREIFAAEATPTTSAAELDCRIDPRVKWEKHELGAVLQQLLCQYVEILGLTYGSIDMRLTPEGRYVFFEIDTGHALCNAMAAMLVNARTF